MITPQRKLQFVLVLSASVVVVRGGAAVAARSDDPPGCADYCSLGTSCSDTCVLEGDMPQNTTCEAFTDGQCGDSCDTICSPYYTGDTPCQGAGGGDTTCEAYGLHKQCGDGVCTGLTGDDCSTCTTDCGACLPVDLAPSLDTQGRVAASWDTMTDAAGACELMTEEDPDWVGVWNCPTFDFLSKDLNSISCDGKTEALAEIDGDLADDYAELDGLAMCDPDNVDGDLTAAITNDISSLLSYRDEIQGTPCYMFIT